MLLSNVLLSMNYDKDYTIVDEREFKYLALTESVLTELNCIFIDNKKYISGISSSVSMVLTDAETAPLLDSEQYGICICDDPRLLFFYIHNFLSDNESYKRNDYKTIIGNSCSISPLSVIAASNVTIGDNVIIEEFAVIRENTKIGDNTIIRSGAKIGGQGYEFKRKNDHIVTVNHIGGVIIGQNVEIQYNTCIDKAVYPWDNTIIGDYSKLDNLIHVGHAVKVENNVMIVANSGIGGRTVIKSGTWIGFAATIVNGTVIGENSRVNMGAVVSRKVDDGASVTGNFAIDHAKFIRNLKIANSDD